MYPSIGSGQAVLNWLINLVSKKPDGTIISSYTYTLDDAGNRTKVVEHTGRTVEYTYDDAYKLLEEKITTPDSSTSVISYTYDVVGNRLTRNPPCPPLEKGE